MVDRDIHARSASSSTSSIWDRSFLLAVVALFSAGTLLTLDHLFSPRRHPIEPGLGDDVPDDADADADADADGGDD
jgi:hypothetical protein